MGVGRQRGAASVVVAVARGGVRGMPAWEASASAAANVPGCHAHKCSKRWRREAEGAGSGGVSPVGDSVDGLRWLRGWRCRWGTGVGGGERQLAAAARAVRRCGEGAAT